MLLQFGTNWKSVTSVQRQLTASEKLSISATNFYEGLDGGGGGSGIHYSLKI